MKAILEIRSGEGGDDAKLFIYDMFRMYSKYCSRHGIKIDILDSTDSEIITEIEGDIKQLVDFEGGVHRLQRVPPTESKGRRHSSTMTVAVLPIQEINNSFDLSGITIEAIRGKGPGGQHRNTSDTAIRARHEATGIEAVCTKGRSQWQNKQNALNVLFARVKEREMRLQQDKDQESRQKQIGNSGRSEKIRTYNFIENRVKDERVGRALYCLDRVMNGELDRIYGLIR